MKNFDEMQFPFEDSLAGKDLQIPNFAPDVSGIVQATKAFAEVNTRIQRRVDAFQDSFSSMIKSLETPSLRIKDFQKILNGATENLDKIRIALSNATRWLLQEGWPPLVHVDVRALVRVVGEAQKMSGKKRQRYLQE